MIHVKKSLTARRKHKKLLKKSKGFYGAGSRSFKVAKQRLEKALLYAYKSRRLKKRNFRRLHIQRINASVRYYGLNYSQFIHGLIIKKIKLNRQMLAELAITEPYTFKAIVQTVIKN